MGAKANKLGSCDKHPIYCKDLNDKKILAASRCLSCTAVVQW